MNTSRARSVLGWLLVVGLAVGVVAGFFGMSVGWLVPVAGAVFVVSGVGHLVLAFLLSSGRLAPGPNWGSSPVGHGLKAMAWLTLGALYLTKPSAAQVPWYVAVLPAIVLLFGFRFEQRAHERRRSV